MQSLFGQGDIMAQSRTFKEIGNFNLGQNEIVEMGSLKAGFSSPEQINQIPKMMSMIDSIEAKDQNNKFDEPHSALTQTYGVNQYQNIDQWNQATYLPQSYDYSQVDWNQANYLPQSFGYSEPATTAQTVEFNAPPPKVTSTQNLKVDQMAKGVVKNDKPSAAVVVDAKQAVKDAMKTL